MNKIQKDEKIGTAFERYESRYLWDLGHCIREYAQQSGQKSDVVSDIITRLQSRAVRCQPVMLKNAETITRVWPTRLEFTKDTQDVPYGKLRAILIILDPDFVAQHKVSDEDKKLLIGTLPQSTFEEFRALVKDLKTKYDPLGESVDFDEMFSDVFEATSLLKEIVESRHNAELKSFRVRFAPVFIENLRKCIAAMKDEKMLQKLRKDIGKDFPSNLGLITDSLDDYLFRVARSLVLLLRSSERRRDTLRSRIGMSELGRLSTLLKAASDESEMERYFRSRQMLEKLTTR